MPQSVNKEFLNVSNLEYLFLYLMYVATRVLCTTQLLTEIYMIDIWIKIIYSHFLKLNA